MMKRFKIAVTLLLFLTMFRSVNAQDLNNLDPDEMFSIARTEVFEGKKGEGQDKLRYILEKNPRYHEVRIFLARSYAWEGLYGQARTELQTILKKDSTYRDAVNALIDVEMWSRNFEGTLAVVQKARRAYPNDEWLLYKEVNVLTFLGRNKEALLSLSRLLQLHPAHEAGIALYDSIRLQNRKYTAEMTLGAEFFNRVFDPAYYVTAQVSRRNSWGASVIRLNYANRFSTYGTQGEVDLYPKITKSIFAHINYGFSESELFPENRAGGELFFNLPGKLETSAGIRYMDFHQGTSILIYTGSVGYYFKNYWFSIRPFITPDETGTSVSATFSARYFMNAESYLEVNSGFGFSPDLRRLQNGTGLSENAIYLLKSQRVGVTWQQVVHPTWTMHLSVHIARQELDFDQNKYVLITGSFLSLRKKI